MTKGRSGRAVSEIRLNGGEFKGHKLRGVQGTRPTPALAREALFDILRPMIEGARFLDLYAGTGAVGLEAISRGAGRAALVERSRAAAEALRENVSRLGCGDRVEIIQADALAALRRFETEENVFDIVFLDPPYDLGLCGRTLAAIPSTLLAPGGILIVQASPREPVPEAVGNLRRFRERKYGEAVAYFFHKPTDNS